MNFPKEFCRTIRVDPNAEPKFGSGQAYNGYPVRVPTVRVPLLATDELMMFADQLRLNFGYEPGIPDYRYQFSIGLNGFTPTGMDNCIEFFVMDSDAVDYGMFYVLELDEEAQVTARGVLDVQMKVQFGFDCAGILREAEALISGSGDSGEATATSEEPPIECEQCGRPFAIQLESRVDGDRRFQFFRCPHCSKVYIVTATDKLIRQRIAASRELDEASRDRQLTEEEISSRQWMKWANQERSERLKRNCVIH